MPQEIEVWYLIPALRRELAKVFIKDYKMSQKEAADILGITSAAISQYLNSKRGSEIKFSNGEIAEIKMAAEKIAGGKKSAMKEIYELSVLMKKSKAICAIHRSRERGISKECDICFR